MSKMKINGKSYETFKDKDGVLRFKPNNLILKLKVNFDLKISEIIKLVELDAISMMDLILVLVLLFQVYKKFLFLKIINSKMFLKYN